MNIYNEIFKEKFQGKILSKRMKIRELKINRFRQQIKINHRALFAFISGFYDCTEQKKLCGKSGCYRGVFFYQVIKE